MGPTGFVATPGSHAAAAVAAHLAKPVWVVAGVGRVLPGPLWSALLRRIRDDDPWDAAEEVVPLALVDRVVRPEGLLAPADALTRTGCPVAPELMREMHWLGTKQRDVIRMTEQEVDEFLLGRHTMSLATINHDDTVHLVAMWYGFLEGCVAIETKTKSQKVRNLRRDPRMTCMVEDGDSYEELRGSSWWERPRSSRRRNACGRWASTCSSATRAPTPRRCGRSSRPCCTSAWW